MPISLKGQLKLAPEDCALVEQLLPEHIRLSRAEPGCLSFHVTPCPTDPMVLEVRETFTDRAAFDAHQSRTKTSAWGIQTAHIPRLYEIEEVP